jgi:hypothetical protein
MAAAPTACAATTTAESDIVFSIQTDTVVEPSVPCNTDGITSASITSDVSTSTNSLPSFPYSGTCSAPLMTGNRPFWASSGYDPFDCGAEVILLDWTIYCCKGLMIDVSQPLIGQETSNGTERGEMCFENIRCCSDDPNTTNAPITSCTVGTPATLLLESQVSTAFYATASTTCTDFFCSDSSSISSPTTGSTPTSSSTPTGSSNAAQPLPPSLGSLALLLLLIGNPAIQSLLP